MNICIIPARGGSKRIPRKNIKNFLGKEIIAYSIEAALESKCFDKVIVSTDCHEIRDVAEKFGASCDQLRPDYLSDDFTGTSEVIKYEIKRLSDSGNKISIVTEIYATAPLMKPEFIKQGIDLLMKLPSNSYVFSAVEFEYPVQRGFEIVEDRCHAIDPEAFNKRSQDLKPIFHDAAQFYVGFAETWLNCEFRFNSMSYPFILPRENVVDIDNESDWKIAEAIAMYGK